jgi:hypothetical protein
MTVDQACQVLGISRRTFYRYAKEGKLILTGNRTRNTGVVALSAVALADEINRKRIFGGASKIRTRRFREMCFLWEQISGPHPTYAPPSPFVGFWMVHSAATIRLIRKDLAAFLLTHRTMRKRHKQVRQCIRRLRRLGIETSPENVLRILRLDARGRRDFCTRYHLRARYLVLFAKTVSAVVREIRPGRALSVSSARDKQALKRARKRIAQRWQYTFTHLARMCRDYTVRQRVLIARDEQAYESDKLFARCLGRLARSQHRSAFAQNFAAEDSELGRLAFTTDRRTAELATLKFYDEIDELLNDNGPQ